MEHSGNGLPFSNKGASKNSHLTPFGYKAILNLQGVSLRLFCLVLLGGHQSRSKWDSLATGLAIMVYKR